MKKIVLIFALVSQAACYSVATGGPGASHGTLVFPLQGSIIVQVYNYCAPTVTAEGTKYRVVVPFGASRELALPAETLNDNGREKTAVLTAYDARGRQIGVLLERFYPEWNANVTRRQYIVGGQYNHLYDSAGNDACVSR